MSVRKVVQYDIHGSGGRAGTGPGLRALMSTTVYNGSNMAFLVSNRIPTAHNSALRVMLTQILNVSGAVVNV